MFIWWACGALILISGQFLTLMVPPYRPRVILFISTVTLVAGNALAITYAVRHAVLYSSRWGATEWALKAATTTLRDAMLGALSKRAAENVNDEIEGLPDNLSMRAIESAQNGIIDVVRQLETEGEISLESD